MKKTFLIAALTLTQIQSPTHADDMLQKFVEKVTEGQTQEKKLFYEKSCAQTSNSIEKLLGPDEPSNYDLDQIVREEIGSMSTENWFQYYENMTLNNMVEILQAVLTIKLLEKTKDFESKSGGLSKTAFELFISKRTEIAKSYVEKLVKAKSKSVYAFLLEQEKNTICRVILQGLLDKEKELQTNNQKMTSLTQFAILGLTSDQVASGKRTMRDSIEKFSEMINLANEYIQESTDERKTSLMQTCLKATKAARKISKKQLDENTGSSRKNTGSSRKNTSNDGCCIIV